MRLRRAQPQESREVREWIKARHYLRTAPPGYRVALEFMEGQERVGAMLWGRPAARSLDPELWLELTRMYFLDEAPRNTESRALAMARRWIRVWLPQVRGLLAYSDPSVGHSGTVYAADGWAPFGRTRARHNQSGWRSRAGRKGEENYSRKTRWVRTP